MPKFGDLTALTGPNVAAGDLLVIDDVSATASKSVRGDALLQGALVAATNKLLDSSGNELLIFSVTASAVNEITVTNAATGNGPLVAVTGNDTNAPLSIDAKGSGVINLNVTATGNVKIGTNLQMASGKAIVDANGNKHILFPATVASAVNQLSLTNSATGNPVLIAASGSDTNIGLKLDSKGSGTIALQATGTGNVTSAAPVVITSASATAFVVGRQGTTNPGFAIDASTATNVTGLKITPAAAAAGVAVLVTSSGTDESLKIDAKGAGTISLNTTGTGNVITSVPVVVTSASATALAVGRQGSTNPVLTVDASTATVVTGVSIKGAAAAAGVAIAVTSSGTNEGLKVDAKGSGTIAIGSVSTGLVSLGRAAQNTTIFSGTKASIATQNSTPTAAQLLGGYVSHASTTGAGTATLDTAANIDTAIAGVTNGDSFECIYSNTGTQTVTITTAAGLSLKGTLAIPSGKAAVLYFFRTGSATWDVVCVVSA